MSEMSDSSARQPVGSVSRRDLLVALLDGSCLAAVVPITLDIVERDSLATAGCFRGDLLRGLMEVPGAFWGSYPRLYDRYLTALRAGAERRRRLPPGERMEFWSVLDRATVDANGADRTSNARG
jgi:CBS domain-containing protein